MGELDRITSKNFNYEGVDYTFSGLLNEHIFKHIPWYEHDLLKYIKSLNLNGVYIDVGGNIGNHSLYFANHCNSTELFVFEPEELCYEILSTNLDVNVKNMKVINRINSAVWDRKTTLKLIRFSSFNNTGMSSVVECDNVNDCSIPAISLDETIPTTNNVVLIKIDAEGSEPKVLLGGINTIMRCLPVIVCEAATLDEFNAVDNILKPLGYITPTQRFNATATYVWKLL